MRYTYGAISVGERGPARGGAFVKMGDCWPRRALDVSSLNTRGSKVGDLGLPGRVHPRPAIPPCAQLLRRPKTIFAAKAVRRDHLRIRDGYPFCDMKAWAIRRRCVRRRELSECWPNAGHAFQTQGCNPACSIWRRQKPRGLALAADQAKR